VNYIVLGVNTPADRLQGGNVNVPVTDELAARYEERLKTCE